MRAAKDLDLWIEATADNAKRVAHALASVGTFLTQEQVDRLAKPDLQMRLRGLYTEIPING